MLWVRWTLTLCLSIFLTPTVVRVNEMTFKSQKKNQQRKMLLFSLKSVGSLEKKTATTQTTKSSL